MSKIDLSANSNNLLYPEWVVLHVPHDSTIIPASVRSQFLLGDSQLVAEIQRVTDHHTMSLFVSSEVHTVCAPVSRLVVDVERFPDDRDEPMSKYGMGAIYTATSQLEPLRRSLTPAERCELLNNFYWPHHKRLESIVSASIFRHGQCLVLDCHSFPDLPLPYELSDNVAPIRPDICIGTDCFHTSDKLCDAFVKEFKSVGLTVAVNTPFSGALVPVSRYRKDRRVSAIMVEVNRRLYLSQTGATRSRDFETVARMVKSCCARAINASVV